jgi:glycosyltransferase involved in cell wall biosynthesis
MRLVHYYRRALVGDGGPTRAMWQWANAIHKAGCNVAVIYDADLEAQSPLRNPAIPVIPLKHSGAGLLRMPRGLGAALAPDDVLVFHSTYTPSNIGAARAALLRDIPYIVMPHGGYNKRARERRRHKKQLWLPVERWYLERSLAVHLFFDTETADAAEVAPNARWLLAPTGFDLPTARWDGGTGGYLAWIGRYDIRTKGLDLLVQAMSRLPTGDRRPLRLHGKRSEDCADDIYRIAQGTGVTDAVTVGGQLIEPDKGEFLRRAVAYVHPSRWDSHSLAIVEALAYGIPTVVSVFCSIASRLRAEDAAVIIDPNPEDIAQGISAVLRSPQRYSDRAVHFVRTNLAWSVIMKNYLEQIASLLAGRNR